MSKSLIKISRQPRQASYHVKKGDEVVVISGAQRGSRGKVLKISRVSNRVLVEGVNMIKKAARPTQENPKGGVTELEGSIHISNLILASDFAKSRRQGAAEAAATPSTEKPAKAASKKAPKAKQD